MTAAIQINQLTIKSANKILVDNLNLTLNRGETLTILGETGAGKSLLAQAIVGDLPEGLTVSGTVTVNGVDMLHSSVKQRQKMWGRQVVMLPQEPWRALSPVMNIVRQVAEVGRFVFSKPKSVALAEAKESLVRLGLWEHGHKVPSQLSGGMAQRTAFACIQATSANLLIADEPTKGLDSRLRDNIVQQLKSHAIQGSLLTITHDVDVARQLGGNIIVMCQGKVEETGEAGMVINTPSSKYAQSLIGALPRNWSKVERKDTPSSELVSCRHFSVKRGNKILFGNVNLSLGQGEIVGLFGPSGSGKTSLADALLGILPHQGTVVYRQPLQRQQMLKLYQDPPSAFSADFPLLTLLNDVCERYHVHPQVIQRLCGELNLDEALFTRNVEQVSGGELQRIALLRALMLKPKLLVADEPVSRLDPITSQKITQLLTTKCREMNCTLLLISHDLEQLEKVCDRVLYMETLN